MPAERNMKDATHDWIRSHCRATLALLLVLGCSKSRPPGAGLEPLNPGDGGGALGTGGAGGRGGVGGGGASAGIVGPGVTGTGGTSSGGVGGTTPAATGGTGPGGTGGSNPGTAGAAGGTAPGGGSGGTTGTAGSSGASGARDAATSPGTANGDAGADARASVDMPVIPPPEFLDAAVFVPPPASPMPVLDACARSAMVQCTALRECAVDVFRIAYGTDETCREVSAATCRRQLALPGTGDSVARLDACTAARRGQTCADLAAGTSPDACRVPSGTLGEGALCNTTLQCGEGLFCNLPVMTVGTSASTGPCGRCAKQSPVGGPCTVAGGCPMGSACVFTGPLSAGGQCVPIKATGDACTTRDFCQNGRCLAGLCVALNRGGPGADCNENPCDTIQGIYCNNISRKCEANPPPAKAGEYCGPRRDGSNAFVQCEAGTACTGLAEGGFVRTCEPASKEGEPCATAQDPLGRRCLVGLSCLMGKCERPMVQICVAAP